MSQKSALLVCDMQNVILNFIPDPEVQKNLIENSKKALEFARKAGHLIIFIKVVFRAGYTEVNPNNKMFSMIKTNNMLLEGTPGAEVIDALKPLPNELQLHKVRVGAFSTTHLGIVLESQNIEHIILLGVATSGVILSTVRDASDKDFKITVLSDAVADRNPVVQDVLLKHVFPGQADVITVAEFTK